MALSITQLQTLIAEITDLSIGTNDSDDVTPTLVNTFIQEAYQRIVSLNVKWPWFQTVYELNTVASQQRYDDGFTRIHTTAPLTPATGSDFNDIRTIISVTNESNGGNQLIYIDDFLAQKYWNGTTNQPAYPVYYSLWAGGMNVWPMPNGVYTLNIRAFRQPSYDWLTDANLTVDLNTEFSIMIINYAAARLYQYQEDPEMAAVFMRTFDEGVALARNNLSAPNPNQDLVLSGGLQIYPWNGGWPGLRNGNLLWWR
tara:strand:- start:3077 stop:3844 length:768 start_codon:yes stop_codon:yes gene_type:complete